MQRNLKELTDSLGVAHALEIVRRWGNRSLYVPTKVDDGDDLVLVIGLEAARKLCAAYGGEVLQIPGERSALMAARNDAILASVASGVSHEKTAARFGLARQQVSYIVKQARERQEFAGACADHEARQCPPNNLAKP